MAVRPLLVSTPTDVAVHIAVDELSRSKERRPTGRGRSDNRDGLQCQKGQPIRSVGSALLTLTGIRRTRVIDKKVVYCKIVGHFVFSPATVVRQIKVCREPQIVSLLVADVSQSPPVITS